MTVFFYANQGTAILKFVNGRYFIMNHNEGLNLTRILEVRWCIQDPWRSLVRMTLFHK